jgi:GR25 family glycosyltransferase involved in LPS biosynthesis/glycosyltransferase involved in cell wall biosynthesis
MTKTKTKSTKERLAELAATRSAPAAAVSGIPKQATICLNMIVKNEAHVITRTFDNILSYIPFSYWVIADTGSTDGTQDLIKRYFADRGIPGKLVEHPWKDFGWNRSKALKEAYGLTDYVFVWDADDSIVGDFKLPVPLVADSYSFGFGDSTCQYQRCQLFNNHKRWHYVGVLHEFPECMGKAGPVIQVTGNYHFVSGREGDRNKTENKYLKDAQVLERALEDDPTNSRNIFYCANSYRDAGMADKAVEFYKRCLTSDAWTEEKYVACFQIFDLMPDNKGLFYAMESYKYSQERIEGMYRIIRLFVSQSMDADAWYYYTKIQDYFENRYKLDSLGNKLFVKGDEYDFYLPYYMIICAIKTDHRATAAKMTDIIFTRKYIANDWHINNLFHNLQFLINDLPMTPEFIRNMLEYRQLLTKADCKTFENTEGIQSKTFAAIMERFKARSKVPAEPATGVVSGCELAGKSLVVNLARRPDRRDATVELFEKTGIKDYTFFTAVDGMELTATDEIKELFAGNDFYNMRAVVGCALSHYRIWQQLAVDDDHDYYIIYEDDILSFSSDYLSRLEYAKSRISNIDILMLGHHMWVDEDRVAKPAGKEDILPIIAERYVGGTFGYIITKSGAKKALDFIKKDGIRYAIDKFMTHIPNFRFCTIQPHILFSDWVRPGVKSTVDSDIQKDFKRLDIPKTRPASAAALAGSNEKRVKLTFQKGLDSWGNDIVCLGDGLTIQQLVEETVKLGGVAFNTLGYIKSRVKNELVELPGPKNEQSGLYVITAF